MGCGASGRRWPAHLALGAFLACHAPPAAEAAPRARVHTAAGEVVLRLEVAADAASRSRGLMGRRSLAADAGMVFVFADDAPRAFWMRDTPLSLDILCIEATPEAGAPRRVPAADASSGVITAVLPKARPFDETSLHCRAPSRWVLEMAAGEAHRQGIRPGCRVTWERLPAAAEATR